MPVTYCDESYEEVMTWTEDTKIEYAPNRKSGKSFIRYGKYMKAKTVGEALRLGTYGLDLLFDHEKKLLWATGGPKRERPPEVTGLPREELKAMNQTDVLLGKMYAKWKSWKATFAAIEEQGISRKELKELNDTQDPEGGKDSIIVALGRRKAQDHARQILKAIEAEGNRPVKDDEVLACLQLWGFKENSNRGNVTPDGQKFVYSDTVGLIKMSTCERTLLTVGTKRYPEFSQLITRWLKERLPAEFEQEFTYTSININKNYAGRLHRDGNNAGPSFIKAFGDFQGGELNYWPSDDKRTPLEEFKDKDKVTLNIKENLLLFDGNRGHSVNPFTGERYTLVFFSVRTWSKAPEEEVRDAISCGIPVPTKASMAYAQSLLAPSGPQGCRAWPVRPDGRGGARPSGSRKGGEGAAASASAAAAATTPGQKRPASPAAKATPAKQARSSTKA